MLKIALATTLIGFAGLIAAAVCERFAEQREEQVAAVAETFVTLSDGRRMRVREFGVGNPGPTIVLESGLGATVENWRELAPRLATFAHVLAYDRAGIGFSDAGRLPRSAKAVAKDLDELLLRANIRSPIFPVCYSMGGLHCRAYIAASRDRVLGAVFMDPTEPDEWTLVSNDTSSRSIALFHRIMPMEAITASLGIARLRSWLAADPKALATSQADPRVAAFRRNGRHLRGVAYESTAIYQSFSDVEDTLPSLASLNLGVLASGLPRTSDIAKVQALHRKLSLASTLGRFLIVKNADHVTLRDDPQVAETVVVPFIKDVYNRARASAAIKD